LIGFSSDDKIRSKLLSSGFITTSEANQRLKGMFHLEEYSRKQHSVTEKSGVLKNKILFSEDFQQEREINMTTVKKCSA